MWNKTPTTIVLSIYMCTTVLCIYVYGVPTVVLVHWTLTFTNIHIELSLSLSLPLNIYVYTIYYQLDAISGIKFYLYVSISFTRCLPRTNIPEVVYLQQIKKKAKTEGKTCHAKTMLSLEKPIKLLWKTPHMCRKSPRSEYEGRS